MDDGDDEMTIKK